MEADSIRWFIGDILQALAWGPPYWPEIVVAIATVMCVLWLIMRLKRASEKSSEEPDE